MSTRASVRSKIRLANRAGMQPDEHITTDSAFTAAPQPVRVNPLADLIDDEAYELLKHHRLLDSKSIRDYDIRKLYRELRLKRIPAADAIVSIQEIHPYLQYDTIRKIVYQIQISNAS